MMKSTTDNAKVTKKIKDYKIKDYLFAFQFISLILSVAIIIYTYLIAKNYQYVSDFAIALTLIIMAINNNKIYKRKNFTIIYIVVSILFIFSGIWGISNGWFS